MRQEIQVPNDLSFDPQIHGEDEKIQVLLKVRSSELNLLLELEAPYFMEKRRALR